MAWNATWIWGGDDPARINAWRYFRHTVTIPAGVERASLDITADTSYELFVNGAYVGRGPARGFPFHMYYDTYDVQRYLRPDAANCVAVLVNHLGDHNMSYICGRAGLLCQLTWQGTDGVSHTTGTDRTWRTLDCAGIRSHTPRIAVQMAYEEQVDARLLVPGWETAEFDASHWEYADEIGPVGVAPWTHLAPRPIPHLTENVVTPQAVRAVELARLSNGYRWSFDVRHLAGTSRHGLRSAPAGERGWIVFTEITAEAAGEVRLHTFPNYEAIPIRINNQYFESGTGPHEVQLRAGRNLVMLRSTEWPAILFETDASLDFSADRFAPGAAWAFTGPFNELDGELERMWAAPDLDALRGRTAFKPIEASANYEDIFMLTTSQHFWAIEGGFCAAEIGLATPRQPLPGSRRVIDNTSACLHTSPAATVVFPQPDGDVHLVIDFGREIIGYVEMELDASEGTVIDANCFEGIDETGIFWTINLRNTFRYVCSEGHQVFVSHRRRGFRYVSLTLRDMKRPLRLYSIRTRLSTYPVEQRGSFRCSDEVLNRIWDVAAYTVQLCMLDTYTDCPAYEQVFWVGDARNSALVNNVAFGAHELTAHSINLAGLSLSDEVQAIKPEHIQRDHLTTSHVVSGWFDEIPMWTFLWVWMTWEHYLYTGDRTLLSRQYESVKVCLERCAQFLSPRDLFAIPDVWNLVDWAAMDLERHGEVVANTALLARALDFAAEMAVTLSVPAESAHYQSIAQRLRAALNRFAWSESQRGYVDTIRDAEAYAAYCQRMSTQGLSPQSFAEFQQKQRISECTNTLMLLCKCVPGERYEATLRYALAARQGHFRGSSPQDAYRGSPDQIVPVGSPWFLFFTLETLFNEGYADDAMAILREQWQRMLDKGATTFWETFPAESDGVHPVHWSRSLCHGWSAAPAYFLTSKVLGVTPLEPGYAKVRIAPQPFGLTWAEGTIPTVRGDIYVRWQLSEAGSIEVTYMLPGGVEAVTSD